MLAEAAARHKIVVVGGSMPERGEGGRLLNTSLVFDADGRLMGKFSKVRRRYCRMVRVMCHVILVRHQPHCIPLHCICSALL